MKHLLKVNIQFKYFIYAITLSPAPRLCETAPAQLRQYYYNYTYIYFIQKSSLCQEDKHIFIDVH